MEYCDYDLQQFIQSANYPLDGDIVKALAHQILLALEHMHSHRIIHRDLKPSNIMISNGLVKVGDFGSAEHLSKLDNQG